MRGVRYVLVLAGACVLAAGCGTTSAQTANLAAAAGHTAGQRARVAVTISMRTGGMAVSFTQTGVFDFAHSRGMLSMQGPMGMTEIFLPPTTYIKIPGGGGGPLPHGKSWIAVHGALGGPVSSFVGPFGGGADPADLLASLTAISSSVAKLGTSTVRGVPVTGYLVKIDPAKAAAQVPHQQRAGMRDFARLLGRGAIPVQVWVDGQNLVRRVRLSLHLPGGMGAPGSARMVQVTDFYAFGVPVHVSAPPAAQVTTPSRFGSSVSFTSGGSPRPPKVTGTLSPAQASAAEQAAGAFWAALGHNDPAAVAQTVPPAQRSCVRSILAGGPKITVTSFRIVSAQPAGTGRATVRFTVKAHASIDGHNIPVFPQGPGRVQWLATTEKAGQWYVDLAHSGAFVFGGACP